MPIGSELNETLPAVGDSAAVAAARIIDTFEKIIEAVEGEVSTAALDMDNNLEMNAHAVRNASAVELVDGFTSAVGGLYRSVNDLWWVHPDGAFKITDGVGLNAAGVGGIGGDYGAGDETLDYDATNDRYDFLDDAGDFSDIRTTKVWLRDAASGADAKLNYVGAAGPTWTLSDLSGSAGLALVSATGTVTVGTTIAPALTLSAAATFNSTVALNAAATFAVAPTFAVGAEPKHGEYAQTVSLGNFLWATAAVSAGVDGLSVTGATTMYIDLDLPVGHRITGLGATVLRSASAGTASIRLWRRYPTGFGIGHGIQDDPIDTAATITDTNGVFILDKLGLTTTVTNRETYQAQVILPTSGDALASLEVYYDKVA